jgi:hypothetical protein
MMISDGRLREHGKVAVLKDFAVIPLLQIEQEHPA